MVSVPAFNRTAQTDIKGVMVNGEKIINPELSPHEIQEVHTQLEQAVGLGYDSCIITSAGTYVTKKIYP